MDCSRPGSSVHGILQARILAWVAFPSPGDLPDPGIEPGFPELQVVSLPSEPPGKHWYLPNKSNVFSYIFYLIFCVLCKSNYKKIEREEKKEEEEKEKTTQENLPAWGQKAKFFFVMFIFQLSQEMRPVLFTWLINESGLTNLGCKQKRLKQIIQYK